MQDISLDLIFPNPDQPRKHFDPVELAELAGSIARNGLLQPITVRPSAITPGTYELVAGERRWRAHCHLRDQGKLPSGTVCAIVRSMDDMQRDVEAIVENLARVDIKPLEEARAFKRLLDMGMTEAELAQKLGMQQAWRVGERVRLLNLSPELMKLYESGQLAAEAGYEICRLTSHADQTRIVQAINRGQLSGYKAIRAAVNTVLDGLSQADIFGASAPVASEKELRTLETMEKRIEQVGTMLAAGWKDGECVVARKVSPDRTRLMADKIKAMRSALLVMENELRTAAAQADLALAA